MLSFLQKPFRAIVGTFALTAFAIACSPTPNDATAPKESTPQPVANQETCPIFINDPTESYERMMFEGWELLVSGFYKNDLDRKKEILNVIKFQLKAINRTVPEQALARLRDTLIWVEYPGRGYKTSAYHPDIAYLRRCNINLDKLEGIELDYEIYELQNIQPWVVLHELAHAYHYKILDKDHIETIDAFEAASQSGKYAKVMFLDNDANVAAELKEAYAMTDEFEYFSELTEAYFGKNDYQPFDRSELKTFDPVGYQVIEDAWTR